LRDYEGLLDVGTTRSLNKKAVVFAYGNDEAFHDSGTAASRNFANSQPFLILRREHWQQFDPIGVLGILRVRKFKGVTKSAFIDIVWIPNLTIGPSRMGA
jgi:hypothetical protein